MLYELLYGRAPWDGDSQYGLLQNIKKIPVKFPDTPTRSEKVKDLLTKMLQVPEKVVKFKYLLGSFHMGTSIFT